MNIRHFIAAATIALGISSISLASDTIIHPGSVNLAEVSSFVQLKVGGSSKIVAKVPRAVLSFAGEQRLIQYGTDKYKIVSSEGTPGLSVSYNNVGIGKQEGVATINFTLTVNYDKGVNYGAHVLKVTFENTVTGEQVVAILLVTVI
jgi:hypothetical protein